MAGYGVLSRLSRLNPFAVRRTSPAQETSRDRIVWLGGQPAGVRMTPDEALRLSTVWACVSVISKSLSACRWDVFQEMPDGNREPRRGTITYRLLNVRPNDEMTAFGFREAALIQALIYGNFIAEIERDTVGRPARLWPIEPDRWCLERDANGVLFCRVTNWDRGDTVLNYSDVYHLHGPGTDGVAGFDVVNMALRTLAHAAAAERFGQAFYGNGTAFGGVLSSDATLTEEQMKELREAANAKHQGPDRAFKFLILGGGMKFTPFATTPEDGQFLETRQHMVEEICRYFGVPPHKVHHLLRATFSNIEHEGLSFVRDALVPWAERMAQEADWKLLPAAGGIKTRLDLDWLAEGDALSKANTDSILVQAGLRSVNELRKQRGWNTIGPDGDKHMIQLNMTTLDKVGMDEPVADEPAEDFATAARTVVRQAVRRGLIRQTKRAQQLATKKHPVDVFRYRLQKMEAEHIDYVLAQLDEAADALGALGVEMEEDARAELAQLTALEFGMLVAAYDAGNVTAWCNIEDRAAAITDALFRVGGRANGQGPSVSEAAE